MPYVPVSPETAGTGSAQFEIDDQIGPFANTMDEIEILRGKNRDFQEVEGCDSDEGDDEAVVTQRSRILGDLIMNERAYLSALKSFTDEFVDPLSRLDWFQLTDRFLMSTNIKYIADLHNSLVDSLVMLMSEPHKTKNIASVFYNFDLLAATLSEDPDLPALRSALSSLEDSFDDIESARRMIENREVIRNINRRLDSWEGPDLVHYGELLLEGNLKLHESGRPKERQFYLLEKILVILRSDRSLRNGALRFRLVDRIRMSREVVKSLVLLNDTEDTPLSFQMTFIADDSKEKKITITAFNPDQRSHWIELQDEILSISSGHQPRINMGIDDGGDDGIQSPNGKGSGKKSKWPFFNIKTKLKWRGNRDGRAGADYGDKDLAQAWESGGHIFTKGFKKRSMQQLRLEDGAVGKEPPLRTTSLRTLFTDSDGGTPITTTSTSSMSGPPAAISHSTQTPAKSPLPFAPPTGFPSAAVPPPLQLQSYQAHHQPHPHAHSSSQQPPSFSLPSSDQERRSQPSVSSTTSPSSVNDRPTVYSIGTGEAISVSTRSSGISRQSHASRQSRELPMAPSSPSYAGPPVPSMPSPPVGAVMPSLSTTAPVLAPSTKQMSRKRRSSASASHSEAGSLGKVSAPSTPSRRSRGGAASPLHGSHGSPGGVKKTLTGNDEPNFAIPTPITLSPLVLKLDKSDLRMDFEFEEEEGQQGQGLSDKEPRTRSQRRRATDKYSQDSPGTVDREIAVLSAVAHDYLKKNGEDVGSASDVRAEGEGEGGSTPTPTGNLDDMEEIITSSYNTVGVDAHNSLARGVKQYYVEPGHLSLKRRSLLTEKIRLVRSRSMPSLSALYDMENSSTFQADLSPLRPFVFPRPNIGRDAAHISSVVSRDLPLSTGMMSDPHDDALAMEIQKPFDPDEVAEPWAPSGHLLQWQYNQSQEGTREWSMTESRETIDSEEDDVEDEEEEDGEADGDANGHDETYAHEDAEREGRRHHHHHHHHHHHRRNPYDDGGGMSGDDEESAVESRNGRFGRRRTARKRPSASAIVDAMSDAVKNLFKSSNGHHRRGGNASGEEGDHTSEVEGGRAVSSSRSRRMPSREGSIGKIGGMVGAGVGGANASPAGVDRVPVRKSSMSDIRGFFKPKRSRNSSQSAHPPSPGYGTATQNLGGVSSPTQSTPGGMHYDGMMSDYANSGSESGGPGNLDQSPGHHLGWLAERSLPVRVVEKIGGDYTPSVGSPAVNAQNIGVIGKLRMSLDREGHVVLGTGSRVSMIEGERLTVAGTVASIDGDIVDDVFDITGQTGLTEGGARAPLRAFPIPDILAVDSDASSTGMGTRDRARAVFPHPAVLRQGSPAPSMAIPIPINTTVPGVHLARSVPTDNRRPSVGSLIRYDSMAQEIVDLKSRVRGLENMPAHEE
ncbi:hypothetical protein BC829DRAFT_438777 [Chytridium lagenaria]|nr:hypothetical protein BC829DRAFT_438777 [Chytridium lagenaria]